jgi:histidinol-phosphatase
MAPNFSREADMSLALKMADAADEISMARYQSQDLVITTKPDNTPVTDADRATEKALRDILATERPKDGLVGEEFGISGTDAKRYWVIDPIDGTKNFMRGVPSWSTLIALIERNDDGTEQIVVGVVSSPALFRRWHAALGLGAYVSLNGGAPKKIHVSGISSISDASVTYSDFNNWGEYLPKVQSLLAASHRTRGFGDFWAHMLVAEGAAEIALEIGVALWDMAAISIIVTEAGGCFSSIDGFDGPGHGSGLSTNTILHSQVLDALRVK